MIRNAPAPKPEPGVDPTRGIRIPGLELAKMMDDSGPEPMDSMDPMGIPIDDIRAQIALGMMPPEEREYILYRMRLAHQMNDALVTLFETWTAEENMRNAVATTWPAFYEAVVEFACVATLINEAEESENDD